MRLFVTAVVLSCAPCVIAQTNTATIPAQPPATVSPAPMPAQRFRRAAPSATAPGAAKTANVPPNTPVVTLKGVCKQSQAKTACETVITREDLDRYLTSSSPDYSGTARGRQAVQYARALAFSALAEQQGLDKDPALAKEIDAQVKLARMRILGAAYLEKLQQQTTTIAEADIQKYYTDHKDLYEQAQVRRLSVPVTVPTETGRPLDRAAITSEMGDLRSRAVAGEDFNQLQQDAFKHLHIQAPPPPVNLLTLRRGSVQGDEAKAFDLKPGEVSAMLDLPAAYVLIKLESKEPVPIETVHQEIEATLRRDRLQRQVAELTKHFSTEFNLQYLGLPSQPDVFGLTAVAPAPVPSQSRIRRAPGNGR